MNQDKYTSIVASTTADFRDRGSKFFAFAFPVNGVEAAKKGLQLLRKEHPKANHHCYAYRLGTDGNNFRSVDDGEPSGSAGKPILNTIDSFGFTDVLVVVVRYFGGTLLGVPGLINAYRKAASDALVKAAAVEKWIAQTFVLEFDYPLVNEVLQLLRNAEATIYEQDLQLFCRIIAGIPKAKTALAAQLTELRGLTIKPWVQPA